MELMWRTSHMSGSNAHYVEELYEQYLSDPQSVPDEWRQYFDSLPGYDGGPSRDVPLAPLRDQFYHLARERRSLAPVVSGTAENEETNRKQVRVLQLINAYRFRGHQKASIDPLGLRVADTVPDLELSFHQLSDADMDTEFQTGSLFIGKDSAPLKDSGA